MDSIATTPAPDYSLTTFEQVVIEKTKLLEALKTNRDNHQQIYDAAVAGYWVKCGEVLNEKKTDFEQAIVTVNQQFDSQFTRLSDVVEGKKQNQMTSFSVGLAFNSHWPLVFPTNHLEDYDRVISMLEFSVADKVKLSSTDFDAYVRNNWSWKKQFVNTNLSFVQSVTGAMFHGLITSGCNLTDNAVYGFASNNY